jgi:hypothetical protein
VLATPKSSPYESTIFIPPRDQAPPPALIRTSADIQAHREYAAQPINRGDSAAAPGWCRRERGGLRPSLCYTHATLEATIWPFVGGFAVHTKPKQDPTAPCASFTTLAEAMAWTQ